MPPPPPRRRRPRKNFVHDDHQCSQSDCLPKWAHPNPIPRSVSRSGFGLETDGRTAGAGGRAFGPQILNFSVDPSSTASDQRAATANRPTDRRTERERREGAFCSLLRPPPAARERGARSARAAERARASPRSCRSFGRSVSVSLTLRNSNRSVGRSVGEAHCLIFTGRRLGAAEMHTRGG